MLRGQAEIILFLCLHYTGILVYTFFVSADEISYSIWHSCMEKYGNKCPDYHQESKRE